MAEYQHFAAIFTTTLIREEFKKVVVDPLKLEFFKCGARTIAIPPVTGRIFPVGMDSTLLTTSSRLAFDPNSYYIAVIARSEKPEVRVALKACEDAVDREITNLSLGEDGLAKLAKIFGRHLNYGNGPARRRSMPFRPSRRCPQGVPRLPHPLERRRPRHPHPEASQSRVREAAIATRATMY
jgi:hypothetical protein